MAIADQIKSAVYRYIMGTEISITTSIASYFAGGVTVISYFDGGDIDIRVDTSPILSISEVLDVSSTTTATASSYGFDPIAGVIYHENGSYWKEGRRKWKVTYLAGHSAIPGDIQLAMDRWEAYVTADSTGAIKSYTTGDDSETYFDIGGIPAQIKSLLSKFKRILF